MVLVAGSSAWVLREWWLGPLIGHALERALAQQVGGRWQIERISGSLVGGMRAHGLVCTQAPTASVIRQCRIGEAAIDYRLLGLLGDEPLMALQAVTLTDVAVELDTTVAQPRTDSQPVVIPALPWTAQVTIAGNALIATAAGAVRLDDLRLSGQLAALQLDSSVQLAGRPLGAMNIAVQHAGPVVTSGWHLSGHLDDGLRVEAVIDATSAQVSSTLHLGADSQLTCAQTTAGWEVAGAVDAAHLAPSLRSVAQVVGVTLPDQGVVRGRGTVDHGGAVVLETVALATGDLTYPGLAVRISDAHWDAQHGLHSLGNLQAQAWPARLHPGLARVCPAAAVIELQALARDGQLAFHLTSQALPAALDMSGTVASTMASSAWATAEFKIESTLTVAAAHTDPVPQNSGEAHLTLAGSWTNVVGKLHLHSPRLAGGGWQGDVVEADAHVSLQRQGDHTLIDGDWQLQTTASRMGTPSTTSWSIASAGHLHADEAGLRLVADLTAPVVAHVTITHPARCTADAAWLAALITMPLHTQGDVPNADLAQLAALLPAGLLPAGLHVDGHVSGRGEVPDLRHPAHWSAAVTLSKANLGGLPPLPPLLDIEGTLHADQDGLTVSSLSARAGGGQLEVAGTMPLPGQPGPLALSISSRDALLFQRPDVRLRANADLRVAGTWAEPSLAGQVHVTDLVATTPVSWFGGRDLPAPESPLDGLSALPAPWNRTQLDLQLTGGQEAQKSLEIRNNVLVATLSLDVTVHGRADLPVPTGEIRCSAGRLSLPFSSYRIDRAALRFLATDPYDPVIEATASSQVQGYQLTAQVTGTLHRPHIDVSSSPPLAPDDALVLASTGRLPAEVKKDGAAASALSVGLPFVGRELQRWILGDGFADDGNSVFDRFVVRYDEERSDRGLPTARLEYQVDGPWYLFGERDVFEAYNLGLMWRWIFNDPARRTPAVTAEEPLNSSGSDSLSKTGADWKVVPAPGVAKLPVSAGTLLETVPARQRQGAEANQPATLASAAQRMMDRLHEAGYPDARVQPLAVTDPGITTVRFAVTPGLSWRVATTRMTGAPVELVAKLDAIVATGLPPGVAPTTNRVAATRTALRSALFTTGHALAQVQIAVQREAPDSLSAQVAITVTPGTRYSLEVATPEITGAVPPHLAQRLADICRAANGRDWTRRQVIELRAQLMQELRRDGYAFAEVVMTCDEPGLLPTLICNVRISPGLPATLGTITLHGFDHTSENYIRQRLDLAPGAPLRDGEPEAAVSRLRRSGVARSLTTKVLPVGEAHDTQPADLTIVAEETPPRSVELAVGYGSYEGARGSVLYRDTNLFGWGRTWEVGGERSQRSYGGHTRVIDRDLLGIQRVLSLTVSGGWREEPSFDRTSFSGETAVRAPLTSWLDLRTAYTIEADRATERTASVDGSEQEGFVINGSLTSSVIWDGRDDRQLPTRGGVAEFGMGVSDPVLGSQVSYVEWSSRLGWVVPVIDERLTAAAQVAGTVRRITDGAETLPIQYRMFLGGSTTVRSFGLDQLSPINATGDALGGLTTAYANLELRARVSGNLHVAAFYDVGKVSERSWSLDGALGQAIGGGVRYHLPIGPLRLDAAYNPGERWAATQSYAIEAAVGFTF